ncbi:MAG: hypothetical protein FWF52_03200 [Candidatus Azobacteroides sp.]|nr:hypothetical protein [Candidatus Azobacteroides sp.]
MANQAYLTRISGKKSETLFEANNNLPIFWLTFLDADSIEQLRKRIANNENPEEALRIKIPKQTFIKNANKGKEYFKEIYKERECLYLDFVKYLDDKFKENDVLELDIVEMINFYENADDLLEDINNAVEDIRDLFYIQQNGFEPIEESVNSFVGNDDFLGGQFRNYSAVYLECWEREETARELYKKQLAEQQLKKQRQRKKESVFLCLFGIIFACAGIFGMIKDPSGWRIGIGTIVFGGLAIGVGILHFKNII